MATNSEPLLGLATTEELLNEIAVRMKVTQNSIKGRELGDLCRQALENLDPGVLRYRTVDADYSVSVEEKPLAQSNREIADLSDSFVRDMVRYSHTPTEVWTSAGTLLSVECDTCHNAWPCPTIQNLRERWAK